MKTRQGGDFVISGIGVVSAVGIGRENFWRALEEGRSGIADVSAFPVEQFPVRIAAEVRDIPFEHLPSMRGIRKLDRSALFVLAASQEALAGARVAVGRDAAGDVGVCTGTTFSHLWSIYAYDGEVLHDGLTSANPALFSGTVVNATSSQISICFSLRGFNATVSTGYTSSLEALRYACEALVNAHAATVVVAGVEALSFPLYFGFQKAGYMGGLTGEAVSCPFDKRRNGPVLGEGAAVFVVEDAEHARRRHAPVIARIRSIASCFDPVTARKDKPRDWGLQQAIREALDAAQVSTNEIDYISSCANSSRHLDRMEVKALRSVFGKKVSAIPVSAIKSMVGETVSAGGGLQLASCIGAMRRGIVPPTMNYRQKDPECDIDCVPNKAQRHAVTCALVISSGPGGYHSACVLERCV